MIHAESIPKRKDPRNYEGHIGDAANADTVGCP